MVQAATKRIGFGRYEAGVSLTGMVYSYIYKGAAWAE